MHPTHGPQLYRERSLLTCARISIVGALGWAYFVTDVNILDAVPEKILVGGGLALYFGNTGAGFVYDATPHAIFVGLVFSMIFGHAPVSIGLGGFDSVPTGVLRSLDPATRLPEYLRCR